MSSAENMRGNRPVVVLVTTAFLSSGDDVDLVLAGAGYRTVHAPNFAGLNVSEQAALLAEAEAVVAGTHKFTAEMMELSPLLRVIARTGVGYDSVDVDAASERGILVANTPGANKQSVAEHVFTLMLACARHLRADLHSVENGAWPQKTGRELSGSTLGIVGLGSIGKTVASIARAFGMIVIAYDPYFDATFAASHDIRSVELNELLERSDFVTLHLALDDTTRHLIDASALSLMKPDAYLINTSRGGIVDEQALAAAVHRNLLAGAGLDVFETEPLEPDSELRRLPQILTTGHIAGATREARSRSGREAAHAVVAALGGQPVANAVNLADIAMHEKERGGRNERTA